jgi:hypothetical protein
MKLTNKNLTQKYDILNVSFECPVIFIIAHYPWIKRGRE